MSRQAEVMDRLAGQVRRALEAADLDAYAGLLDDGVRWGPPGDPVPPCRSRAQVLAWYKRGRDSGTRARVTETVVAGNKILVGMKVTNRVDAAAREAERWQVLAVRGGRITEISGFAERDEAAAWAGLIAARPVPRGAIRWTAPARRLANDLVRLRLPDPADGGALHEYVGKDGGLDGGWVRLPADATPADCQAIVGDWLAGWRNERSFHGPALIITAAGDPELLVGLVGLIDRGGRAAELFYGIAPDRRGRGYASAAARLAARWLLHDRLADLVEVRIDPANTASRRAALAAGFTPAGETGDDLRFVLRRSGR